MASEAAGLDAGTRDYRERELVNAGVIVELRVEGQGQLRALPNRRHAAVHLRDQLVGTLTTSAVGPYAQFEEADSGLH